MKFPIAALLGAVLFSVSCDGPIGNPPRMYRAVFEVDSPAAVLDVTVNEPVGGQTGPIAVSGFPWRHTYEAPLDFRRTDIVSISASGALAPGQFIRVSLYYEEIEAFPPLTSPRLVSSQLVEADAAMTKAAALNEALPWQGF